MVPQRLAFLGQYLHDPAVLPADIPRRIEAVDLDLAPLAHCQLLTEPKQFVVAQRLRLVGILDAGPIEKLLVVPDLGVSRPVLGHAVARALALRRATPAVDVVN